MSTSTSRTSQRRATHVNMNNTPTSRQHPELVNRHQSEPANTSSTSSLNTEQHSYAATCKVCDACYKPAPSRPDLLQVGPDALEAAFMSMCHFCFRCRRPACPACWDKVHQVCAECVQEAHLSFRADVPPLQGTLFPVTASSIGQVATDAPLAPLLVCVRAGRFQQEEALDSHIDTRKTTATAPTQLIQPTQLSQLIQSLQLIQSTEQSQVEVDGRRLSEQEGLGNPARRPPLSSAKPLLPPTTAKEAESETAISYGSGGGFPKLSYPRGRHRKYRNILQTLERVLNVVLFSLLVLIIILILVAELSPGANAWFMGLLHVDIRSEIAYILSVIGHVRW